MDNINFEPLHCETCAQEELIDFSLTSIEKKSLIEAIVIN